MVVDSNLSPIIIKYEKAMEEDPRSRVFAPLAEAYRKVGLLENAFNVLKKGLRYNPDYLLGYLTLAQCYLDKGEFNLSYSTLRPLVSQNRDNIKLQKLFGESAIKTDNKEEALDTFKYLLFLQPKDLEATKRVEQLEKELEEGPVYNPPQDVKFKLDDLKPSPELDKSLDDWVQVDLSHNDSEEELDNESNSSEDSEGWSTDPLLNQTEENSLIVEEQPQDEPMPVITHTLVDLYLKQGHKDKAIELLEKIKEIQPDNEETLKRLSELKEIEDTAHTASEDEGRDNLMAAFDSTNSEQLSSTNNSYENDGDEANVEQVLHDFAGLLRNRAESILSD